MITWKTLLFLALRCSQPQVPLRPNEISLGTLLPLQSRIQLCSAAGPQHSTSGLEKLSSRAAGIDAIDHLISFHRNDVRSPLQSNHYSNCISNIGSCSFIATKIATKRCSSICSRRQRSKALTKNSLLSLVHCHTKSFLTTVNKKANQYQSGSRWDDNHPFHSNTQTEKEMGNKSPVDLALTTTNSGRHH